MGKWSDSGSSSADLPLKGTDPPSAPSTTGRHQSTGARFCSNPGPGGSKWARYFVDSVQINLLNAAASQQSRRHSVYLLKDPALQRSCLLGEPGTASVLRPPLHRSLSPEAKALDHDFIQEQENTVQRVVSSLWSQLRLFTHLRQRAHRSALSPSFWGGGGGEKKTPPPKNKSHNKSALANRKNPAG